MAKRPTVDVDEDYLKEIMAGGIASLKKEQHKPVPEQPKPEVEETPVKEKTEVVFPVETKEPVKQVRKRREVQDYEAVFLERKASVARRQMYVLSQNTLTFFRVNNCHIFTFVSIETMRFFRHERL